MAKIMLSALDQKLSDFIGNTEKILKRIEEQTTKTNGKVAELVGWRNTMKGVWVTICIFASIVSVVMPITISFYNDKAKEDKEIQKIVDERMSKYIEITQ